MSLPLRVVQFIGASQHAIVSALARPLSVERTAMHDAVVLQSSSHGTFDVCHRPKITDTALISCPSPFLGIQCKDNSTKH